MMEQMRMVLPLDRLACLPTRRPGQPGGAVFTDGWRAFLVGRIAAADVRPGLRAADGLRRAAA